MDAQAWDERYAGSRLVWSAEPNRFVVEALSDLPPGRALDLACGEGRNAMWLARQGWRVTAIDFSAVAVERGRELAADLDVEWLVRDALTAELPESDLVLLVYLQLPPEQRRAVVRRAFAAVATGGTFFVVAHDSTNLAEGTGGPQDPAVLYTAEGVVADLDGAGTIVRAERVARPVTGTDDHGGEAAKTAWDALVVARA